MGGKEGLAGTAPSLLTEPPVEKRTTRNDKTRRFWHSCVEGGAAGLDGLNLSSRQGLAVEAGGEVIPVEENAFGRGDGAEVGASSAADTSLGLDGLAEGAELLGVVTVGAEAVVGGAVGEGSGERVGGRGGGGLGRVGDGSCRERGLKSAPNGSGTRGGWTGVVEGGCTEGIKVPHPPREMVDIPGIERLPRKRMEGMRSACTAAWRRVLVANMVSVLGTGIGMDWDWR